MNVDNLLTSLDLAIKINAGATATSTVATTIQLVQRLVLVVIL